MSNDIFPLKSQVDKGDPAPSSPSGDPLYSSPEDGLRGAATPPIAPPHASGFSDEERKGIVNSALTVASKVLIGACTLVHAHDFIEGDCIFPDGEKWRLRFARVSDRSGANEVSGPTKEDGTHAERDPKGDAQEEKPPTNT